MDSKLQELRRNARAGGDWSELEQHLNRLEIDLIRLVQYTIDTGNILVVPWHEDNDDCFIYLANLALTARGNLEVPYVAPSPPGCLTASPGYQLVSKERRMRPEVGDLLVNVSHNLGWNQYIDPVGRVVAKEERFIEVPRKLRFESVDTDR